ncbi:SpvB/TcaC N-terminal domain-containing protein [Rudanella paleaurantiibacter]|nr:SpvB/TcaC N-terminal domain-containing protein [Rudanella paleaurantiibacter]
MVGSTASSDGDVTNFQGGATDIWMVKTNAFGVIQWKKNIGGTNREYANTVRCFGGFYFIGGYSRPTLVNGSNNNFSAYLVKTDLAGNVIWTQTYGGNGDDVINDLVPTFDGGCAFVGYTTSTDGTPPAPSATQASRDLWLVKVNSAGGVEWQSRQGGNNDDSGKRIQLLGDHLDIYTPSGFIVSGTYYRPSTGDATSFGLADLWILKFDATGSLIANKKLGGSLVDVGAAVQPAPDGSYFVVGSALSNDNGLTNRGFEDVYVAKLQSDLSLAWQRTYGGSSYDTGQEIWIAPDGNLRVLANTNSTNGDVTGKTSADNDAWLLSINSTNGGLNWQKRHGGSGNDEAFAMYRTLAGNSVITGLSQSTDGDVTQNQGGEDFWLFEAYESPITIRSILPTRACPGQQIELPITTYGNWPAGTSFSAQLSDQFGLFTNPVTLGTLATPPSGNLRVTIPTNTVSGSAYKIRVLASNPSSTSTVGPSMSIGGSECSPNTISWQRADTGSDYDQYRSSIALSDGGVLVAGLARSNDVLGMKGGRSDALLTRLDAQRNIIWQKTYGGSGDDAFWKVIEVVDGFICVGYSSSKDGDINANSQKGDYDGWIIKVAKTNGAVLWQNTFGGTSGEVFCDVTATSSGFALIGYAESNNGDVSGNHGGLDFWFVQVNTTGQLSQQRCLGGTGSEVGFSIISGLDGSFYVTGYTNSDNNGDISGKKGSTDVWTLKLSASGTIQWQRCFGGSLADYAYGISAASDGGIVIIGNSASNDGDLNGLLKGDNDLLVAKYDPTGNVVWKRMFGGTGDDQGRSGIIQTPDNGFLIGGQTSSINGDLAGRVGISEDAWIIKLNANGILQWQKALGGSNQDRAYGLANALDGGYYMVGQTYSANGHVEGAKGGGDAWLVKLGPEQPNMSSVTATPIGCGGKQTVVQLLTNGQYNPENVFTVELSNANGTFVSPTVIASVTARIGTSFVCPLPNITTNGYQIRVVSTSPAYASVAVPLFVQTTSLVKGKDVTIGGSGSDDMRIVSLLPDGGYLVGGTTNSPVSGSKRATPKGGADFWLFRLNKDLQYVNDWAYGGTDNDELWSIIPTVDGSYLLSGRTKSDVSGTDKRTPRLSSSSTYTDAWIVKIDANGNKLDDLTFGGLNDDMFFDGKPTPDKGFIFVGTTSSASMSVGGIVTKGSGLFGNNDVWVLKINGAGQREWDQNYGGTSSESGYSILPTADGGYVIGGVSTSNPFPDSPNGKTNGSNGGTDYWIFKIDAYGKKLWDKTIGGTGNDNFRKLQATVDGGFLLIGESESNQYLPDKTENARSTNISDYWIVKIDANGNKLWDKTIGGTGVDVAIDIIPTSDGGFIVGGGSASNAYTPDKTENSQGQDDAWLVKIDSQGNRQWDKRYGGTDRDLIRNLQLTTDGDLIAFCISRSNANGDKSENNQGDWDSWAIKLWQPTQPTIAATRQALCGEQNQTNLIASNCPGMIIWSTGAEGNSVTVSPTVSTTYSAICRVNGVASCPSDPLVITVCKKGSQSTYGYTKGNFSVTDGGAATYGIPLILPAGTGGMKPELGLSYSHQGGNGLLGIGWNLDGLHVINRASPTRAQDEAFDVTRSGSIGVTLTKADRFALDGARLVLAPSSIEASEELNANYGNLNTEYITEQQQFIRVTIKELTANGSPSWFEAYTKDGLIMEFGRSEDSRIVASDNVTPLTWLLSKISDRNGNYIRYIYDKQIVGNASTNTYPYGKIHHYPVRIEYTANDAAPLVAYNRIEFDYIDRTDKQWSFLSGQYVGGSDKLLSRVRVLGNGQEVRRYEISYIKSKFTANSLLYQVQECADTLCHEPTVFSWQNEERLATDLTYKPTATTAQGPFSAAAWGPEDKRVRLFGDWDGDGTNDLCAVDTTNTIQTTFTYYLNRFPNSVPNGLSHSLPGKLTRYQYRTADFNADGKTDIILWNTNSGDARMLITNFQNGSWQTPVVKTGSQFIQETCSTDQNRPANNCYPVSSIEVFANHDVYLLDWNSDGITDIVSMRKNGRNYTLGTDYWLQTQPPTFTGNSGVGDVKLFRHNLYIPATMTDGAPTQVFNQLHLADFNNDGLADICLVDSASSRMTIFPMRSVKFANKVYDSDSTKYRIQDPTFSVEFNPTQEFRYNWSLLQSRFIPFDAGQPAYNLYDRDLIIADANGDGLPDLGLKLSQTSYQFQLSTGKFGLYPDPYLITAAEQPLGADVNTELVDFNNDGALDLLTYSRLGLPGSSVRMGGSDKNSLIFDDPLDVSLLSESGVNFFFGHYSKSNLNELLYFKVTGQQLTTKLYNNALSKTDLIGRITEGSGQEIDVTYKTLKDPSVYSRPTSTFRYPLGEFVSPIAIVASVRNKNGIGGYLYTDYQYEGAFTHMAGRGFRGFSKVIIRDRQRNIYSIKQFTVDANRWWLAGLPDRTETRLNDPINGKLLSDFVQVTGAIPFTRSASFAPQPSYLKPRSYYAYGSISTARSFDFNTDAQLTYLQSRVVPDASGNGLLVVANHGEGFRDSTLNQYTDNAASHLLGRLTRSTVYRFSPGQPVQVRTSAFEYRPTTGQLMKQTTDPDSSVQIKTETLYTHDVFGNITQTESRAWNGTQVESRTDQFVFDSRGRFQIRMTNALGQQTSATYDPALGSVLTSTDRNGLVSNFQYDAFGRMVKVTTPTGEETVERIYRPESRFNSPANTRFVMVKQEGIEPPVIEHFDFLNRKIRTDKVNFTGGVVSYSTTFNALGEDAAESGPGLNRQTQYDAMSRPVRVTDYGVDNQYSYVGNQTTVTDIKGRQRTVEKNAQGQVLRSKGFHDGEQFTVSYEYDGRNNPTRVVGNGQFDIKTFYDARGRIIRSEDPVAGTYRMEYNGFGELLKSTNPRGQVTTMIYDKLGRVVQRTEPEGVTSYTYDAGNKAVGKLGRIADPTGIVFAYGFDNFGRLGSETKTVAGVSYVTSYSYNTDNTIDRIRYPSGLVVRHEYNAQNYFYLVRRVSDNKVLWQAKSLNDADALLNEEVYAKPGGPVLNLKYGYDASQTQLNSLETFLPGDGTTARIKQTHTYDAAYNLTRTNEWVYQAPGQLLRSGTLQYGYDDLDRLLSITPNLNFPQRNLTENTAVTMTYDLRGNILTKSDVGTYQYDQNALGGRRYLTGITPANSAVCLPSFTVRTEYTSFNKVRRIENDTSYAVITYGPDRQRVMQQLYVRGTLKRTKIYVNSLYEVEQVGSQTRETSYVRGASGVVAVETKVNTVRTWQLWVKDRLNNLAAVVDTNGAVLQHLRYDAWGRRLNADRPGAAADTASYRTDRGFTKHEHYDLFQLIDMNGRVYDPVVARFLSPDPFVDNPLDLQAYNRYSYVNNNPLTYTDPSGYFKLKKVFRAITKVVNKVTDVAVKVALANPINKLNLKAAYESAKVVAKVLDSKVMPDVIRDHWRPVLTTGAAIVVGVLTAPAGPAASGAASGFTSGFLGSAWSGGSFNDATKAGTKGAIYGAATAYLTSAVGDAAAAKNLNAAESIGVKVVGHATVQGTMAEVQGGNFWEGAAVGAVSSAGGTLIKAAGPDGSSFGAISVRTGMAAVLGGTTSMIGGGKFANGAISGAFVHLYNDEMHDDDTNLNKRVENSNGASQIKAKLMGAPADMAVDQIRDKMILEGAATRGAGNTLRPYVNLLKVLRIVGPMIDFLNPTIIDPHQTADKPDYNKQMKASDFAPTADTDYISTPILR